MTADSGYHSEENLRILDQAKVDAYVATKEMRRRDPAFATAERHKVTTRNGFTGTCYSGHVEDCVRCALRGGCLRIPATRARQVYKFHGREKQQTLIGRMKEKIDSALGGYLYSQRMGIVEPVFGNVRYAKGLDRFTLRGSVKVNIQRKLWGMLHNIEKILTAGWRNGAGPAWSTG